MYTKMFMKFSIQNHTLTLNFVRKMQQQHKKDGTNCLPSRCVSPGVLYPIMIGRFCWHSGRPKKVKMLWLYNFFKLATVWLKRTPKWTFYGIYLPCQFSYQSLNFLKIGLISAEIRIFESPVYSQNSGGKVTSQWHVLMRKKKATNDTKWIQKMMLQMIR